jgi:lipoprotein-releasing system permease protein
MASLNTVKSEFFIAFRYLFGRSNKGERYLLAAACGIALSLIPIMVTLIVADGMIQGISERFLELGTGHIQIRKYRETPGIDEGIEETAFKAAWTPGVRGVWNEIDGIGIVLGAKGKTGATIRAVDPSFWKDEGSEKYLSVLEGSSGFESDGDVLIGSVLAETIGTEAGKKIRIMTLHTDGDGLAFPRTELFTVRGIVSSGYHEIDSMWCLISFEAGKRLLDQGYSDSFLVVKIDDPWTKSDSTALSINENINNNFRVYTWKQVQPAQYSSYETTRQLLLFIMALIVIIAAVNVSSATSMLVIEREHDIAVLKTYGTSPVGISSIFLSGSFLTGAAGAIAGIVLGLLFGVNINHIIHGLENFLNLFAKLFNGGTIKILDPDFYLQTIPIVIDWNAVILIGAFTIICSIAASWFPAARAGRTKPIDLLRKY